MKLWQVMACLANEQHILKKYFLGYKTKDGCDTVDDLLVQQAFSESKEAYYIVKYNDASILRLMPVDDFFVKRKAPILVKNIPIKEAYLKFGGDIITEVIDYGSYELPPHLMEG